MRIAKKMFKSTAFYVLSAMGLVLALGARNSSEELIAKKQPQSTDLTNADLQKPMKIINEANADTPSSCNISCSSTPVSCYSCGCGGDGGGGDGGGG